ncbi:MAG: acetate kinase, partial [Pseudomonadota bacterium]
PMSTRCGSIDPGVVLHLMQQKKMTADEVAACLYTQSGLLGLSGVSGDMRALLASNAPEAEEAIAYYVRRATREIGSLAAVMGGVDALVFTGGVGENAPRVRNMILRASAWLGFALADNVDFERSVRLTADNSAPSAWVIPTNEELMIARHAVRTVAR